MLEAPTPAAVVDSRTFVGSLLVIVTIVFPAGAGAPREPDTPSTRSFPTVTLLIVMAGAVTVAVICWLLLGVEKPADLQSTQLNSSHLRPSHAVVFLVKKQTSTAGPAVDDPTD